MKYQNMFPMNEYIPCLWPCRHHLAKNHGLKKLHRLNNGAFELKFQRTITADGTTSYQDYVRIDVYICAWLRWLNIMNVKYTTCIYLIWFKTMHSRLNNGDGITISMLLYLWINDQMLYVLCFHIDALGFHIDASGFHIQIKHFQILMSVCNEC